VIISILKTCQFTYFTVDRASRVNLKTQFAGNSKNSVGEAHAVLPRFTNLATLTVSDELEVCTGAPNMIVDPGRHKPSRRH